MSTNITIILSPTQKYTAKPTPTTSLNSLLIQACQHLSLPDSPESYLLKHGKTTLDLSLPIRHANLPQGAKLDMILRPARSANALVTIAVQLADGKRLIKKFPASTSLWDVLRANETEDIRIVRREGEGGQWMEPVIRIGNDDIREPDLLKSTTLSSRGLFSGQHILKVSFSLSTEPLPPIDDSPVMGVVTSTSIPASRTTPIPSPTGRATAEAALPAPEPAVHPAGPNHRSLKVYNAPTSSTPHAATLPAEPELHPTAADARAIQASLTARARALDNGGLFLSAAEREKRARELKEKEGRIPKHVTEMEVSVRLPDGARLGAVFGVREGTSALFELVRSSLKSGVVEKKFHLSTGMPPRKVLESNEITIGEELGAGVGITKCLVTLIWDELTSGRESVLKEELASQGQELKGKVLEDVEMKEASKAAVEEKNVEESKEEKKEKKIPKWLMKGLKK
ncbi:hypothetical protein SAICODRAFT_18570 [Saitoella complicata NRRL Y-17804]|nr:uncharacterized protein SAICODRAFT_18570 [Saitoella complicata NRRL Y-17804]ODQ54005.1 hypothetical protein SAICODRAFT_18570 [Saitoella complicata NRRL Y-17804]